MTNREMKYCSIQTVCFLLSCSFWSTGGTLPALMNPCSLSQSIPLVEGICCAISDMNADQRIVTQKTLVEQLVKRYPGNVFVSLPLKMTLSSTLSIYSYWMSNA